MIKFFTYDQDRDWLDPVQGVEIIEDFSGAWFIVDEDCSHWQPDELPKNWIVA